MRYSKIIVVIQARVKSKRLPDKALLKLNGKPSIVRMVNRIKESKLINEIWIATGKCKTNDPLVKLFKNKNVNVFRGDDKDVLSRYAEIIKISGADVVVRLTGDCPLTDHHIMDKAISLLQKKEVDYVSNIINRTYPDGLDVEVFTSEALLLADSNSKEKFSREHVTTYIHGLHKNKYEFGNFKIFSMENDNDFSHLRWTLDEEKDYIFLNELFKKIPENISWLGIISFLIKNPLLQIRNDNIKSNEGAIDPNNRESKRYNKSNDLFKKAKNLIPLASQTFSKSYLQLPKGAAPLFVERAQGVKIVDPDGNHYIDYVLGLLPITLGYCDIDVDQAVIKQIMKGNIFSLPSKLEMELAERLKQIIPSAEMVRYGKNGSDATSAAVRLARAYTSKDLVAVCGYHGWQDWYIGSTTRDLGVPDKIKSLTKRFTFNDIDTLKHLFNKYPKKFAAIVLEPAGLVGTDISFLKDVKELCLKNNALLIFDEIISGFRINLGGAQKEYGIKPDLSCFGKGMANGYPLSAVVGSKKIMSLMEEIFFSATFGGETLSLAASIATINKMIEKSTISKVNNYGSKLISELNYICNLHGVNEFLYVSNINWWPQLVVDKPPLEKNLFLSLLRQEFLKNGLYLLNTFNLCYAHTNIDILNQTKEKFSESISNLKSIINSENPKKYLKGDLISPTFKVR